MSKRDQVSKGSPKLGTNASLSFGVKTILIVKALPPSLVPGFL